MIKLSLHAERQLNERNLSLKDIEKVIEKPDQVLGTSIKGRKIAQKVFSHRKTRFLYRVVFIKESRDYLIITADRTTKINKYLKGETYENKL